MQENRVVECRRRSVVKSLLWRLIGIVWTWIGAYLILLFVPKKFSAAAWVATFIVVYHHTTRMLMYYFYERIWTGIGWGKVDVENRTISPMPFRNKAMWVTLTITAVVLIFFLVVFVTPMIKR